MATPWTEQTGGPSERQDFHKTQKTMESGMNTNIENLLIIDLFWRTFVNQEIFYLTLSVEFLK